MGTGPCPWKWAVEQEQSSTPKLNNKDEDNSPNMNNVNNNFNVLNSLFNGKRHIVWYLSLNLYLV